MAPWRQHAARRRLPYQEAAEGSDRDRFRHLDRIKLNERPARAIAGVVDHDVGRARPGIEIGE
jgi:hypothetical protein